MSEQREGPPIGAARQAIMDVAIEAIVELGYYRATSNEIARRAGVTWGVIQHHFVTREGLLLAALEHAMVTRDEAVARTVITGDTLAERLAAYGRALESFYASPEYLAHLQIVLNLSKDPATKDVTRRALSRTLETSAQNMMRLFDDVLETHDIPAADRTLAFAVMRGLAVDHAIFNETYPDAPRRDVASMIEIISTLLAGYLEHESGGRRQRGRWRPASRGK